MHVGVPQKCCCPGCGICTCGMRKGAKGCCPEHKSEANNIKIREKTVKERKLSYLKGYRMNEAILQNFFLQNIIEVGSDVLTATVFDKKILGERIDKQGVIIIKYGSYGLIQTSKTHYKIVKLCMIKPNS